MPTYILFDHINHKAYISKTFSALSTRTKRTRRQLKYILDANKPVKGFSLVEPEECKLVGKTDNFNKRKI